MSTGNMDVRIGFLLLIVLGALGTSSARQLPPNLEGTLKNSVQWWYFPTLFYC